MKLINKLLVLQLIFSVGALCQMSYSPNFNEEDNLKAESISDLTSQFLICMRALKPGELKKEMMNQYFNQREGYENALVNPSLAGFSQNAVTSAFYRVVKRALRKCEEETSYQDTRIGIERPARPPIERPRDIEGPRSYRGESGIIIERTPTLPPVVKGNILRESSKPIEKPRENVSMQELSEIKNAYVNCVENVIKTPGLKDFISEVNAMKRKYMNKNRSPNLLERDRTRAEYANALLRATRYCGQMRTSINP